MWSGGLIGQRTALQDEEPRGWTRPRLRSSGNALNAAELCTRNGSDGRCYVYFDTITNVVGNHDNVAFLKEGKKSEE